MVMKNTSSYMKSFKETGTRCTVARWNIGLKYVIVVGELYAGRNEGSSWNDIGKKSNIFRTDIIQMSAIFPG